MSNTRELLRWARGRGWTASLTGRNHWRLQHPNGSTVMIAGTPSDWRALRNAQARLKRAERQPNRKDLQS